MATEEVQTQGRAGPRASVLNFGSTCTIVLVDIENRPIMNLHKVPLHVLVIDIKLKISDRLKEVGRNLPADLMCAIQNVTNLPFTCLMMQIEAG